MKMPINFFSIKKKSVYGVGLLYFIKMDIVMRKLLGLVPCCFAIISNHK